jgi:hypothetical protein
VPDATSRANGSSVECTITRVGQGLELAANYPKITVAYAQIATNDHHTLQKFRASVGAQWTFLSDPGRTVQQDLDSSRTSTPNSLPG